MASLLQNFDFLHEDIIHDAQVDFSGARLASCSSDKTIQIFDLQSDNRKVLATLFGHEGSIWQLAWSHSVFGLLLASCSIDKKVILWKEVNRKWGKVYVYDDHDSSVNALSWAPPEFGLMLICGSSDGAISIITSIDESGFGATKIMDAHDLGCTAVSFQPSFICATNSVEGIGEQNTIKRFASGGCDNLIKIWKFDEYYEKWFEEYKLEGHLGRIRSVAWAPSMDMDSDMIASCSEDRRVIIWKLDQDHQWVGKILYTFNEAIWHISWSATGNILAVSGDNKVTLWEECLDGQWTCVNDELDDSDDA